MKKNKILYNLTVALATVSLFFTGCNDDVSGIGNSISSSEVTIYRDSISYKLNAATIEAPALESKSAYTLLGSIRVPEYGALDCSYVTQFLPAEALDIPDSISYNDVDSVKMIFSVPKAYVTGDTLAPQQLKVYSLSKNLPSDISYNFDVSDYYDSSKPLAVKSYTLSGYSYNDTTFTSRSTVQIKADMPVELGRDVFKAYAENPDIFVWPETFASNYWHGAYIEPSFGKGCIAPVQNTSIYAYFPQTKITTQTDTAGNVQAVYKVVADSVCMFTTAPEVVSSVNINYQPSQTLEAMVNQGKCIVTTPGGYTVKFTFPAVDILKEYWKDTYDLGVINNMIFSIPAKVVDNSYGLGISPAMLMIKNSELDTFFSEGKLPDNMSSFASLFDSETQMYTFSLMRDYIVDLKNKGEAKITPEDVEFTLIPVSFTTEDYTDQSTGKTITVVTSIIPYILMPTMAELDTDNAVIEFTFSNQVLY